MNDLKSSTTSKTSTYTFTINFTTLGPISTVFTPSSRCSHNVNFEVGYYPAESTEYQWGRGFECGRDIRQISSGCLPKDYIAAFRNTNRETYDNCPIHSPGAGCPAGYTSACAISSTRSATSLSLEGAVDYNLNIASGETAIGCCPSGFSCPLAVTSIPFCVSDALPGAELTEIRQSGCFDDSALPKASEFTLRRNERATFVAPRYIYIPVRQNTSIPSTSNDTAGSKGNEQSTGELPNGYKAAIGIAISLGIILASVGIFLWFKKRKQRYKKPTDIEKKPAIVPDPVSALEEDDGTEIAEAADATIIEAPGDEGNNAIHELPGNGLFHEAPEDAFAPVELAQVQNTDNNKDISSLSNKESSLKSSKGLSAIALEAIAEAQKPRRKFSFQSQCSGEITKEDEPKRGEMYRK